jgi:hypothetical protein
MAPLIMVPLMLCLWWLWMMPIMVFQPMVFGMLLAGRLPLVANGLLPMLVVGLLPLVVVGLLPLVVADQRTIALVHCFVLLWILWRGRQALSASQSALPKSVLAFLL